jgi:hypothetical protein
MRIRSEEKPAEKEMINILAFTKAEGWFVMQEYQISKDMLEKHGKLISKTEPDIFAIFKEHVINKIRDFYGL